jgi:hypothetical protein
MDSLTTSLLRLVSERMTLPLTKGYPNAAGGFLSRIAAAGVLRLAFRWPALSVVLILGVIIARVMSGRRHRSTEGPPALGAP